MKTNKFTSFEDLFENDLSHILVLLVRVPLNFNDSSFRHLKCLIPNDFLQLLFEITNALVIGVCRKAVGVVWVPSIRWSPHRSRRFAIPIHSRLHYLAFLHEAALLCAFVL